MLSDVSSPCSGAAPKARGRRGFTLVEGLVVIAIITLISTQVIGNHRQYGVRQRLNAVLEDIAVSVRQAQVYASAVRSEGGNFRQLYGLHFAVGANNFILFSEQLAADPVPDPTGGCPGSGGANNCVYSSAPDEQIAEGGTFQLPPGYTISQIESSASTTPDPVVFLFVRPHTEVFFYEGGGPEAWSHVDITVTGPGGVTGKVRVLLSGYAHPL